MASSSQSTVDPETSKPTIQNLIDSLTKSKNLLEDVKTKDSLKKLIAGLKDIEPFLMKSGQNIVVGARLETVLGRIHILSNNLGAYVGQIFAFPAGQLHQEEVASLNKIVSKLKSQLTVNKEISESIIPNLVNHLTKVVKKLQTSTEKVKGNDKDNMLEHLKKLLMSTEKVQGYDKNKMLEHLNKLIANLDKIKRFFMNSGQDIAEGAQVKNVLESILHKLSNCLKTVCGLKVALRAVLELKTEFEKLNEIVSKLERQEETKSKILNLVDRLRTEAENLINSSDNKAKARGVLVKSVLERTFSAEKLYDLGTDDDGKKVDHLPAMKAKLDELMTLIRLKDQVLSAKSGDGSTKVSEISETIIPGVVKRLQLANMYSQKAQSAVEAEGEGADKGEDTGKELKKLTNDLSYIRSFLKNMEDNSKSLSNKVKTFEDNATVFVNALIRHSDFQESQTELQGQQQGSQTELQDQELKAKIRVLNKVVMKLKHQISSSNKLSPTDSDADWYKKVMSEFDHSQVLDILPVLHQDDQKFKSSQFKSSPAFRDFRKVYENLKLRTKLCLLCFAVIPENEVVKKRFMTHWWFGEGFVSSLDDNAADQIFEELVNKNCIEPVDEKYKYVVDSYKMNPLIRSAVILLAKEAQFFDFDDKNNPSAIFHKSYRACLVDEFKYGELFKSKIDLTGKNGSKRKNEGSGHEQGPTSSASDSGPKLKLDPEKLQVIFNVNEPYPDVFDLEWFSKLKNVKVLYLGRWQTSAKHHIEVEGIDFLTGLKSMKLLRFLSLQGISRITKLPDSVSKLVNLTILDLRACHNLEAIPSGIGSLKSLTHLDISECYLVDYMPKEIISLSKLQVLKGFVISHHDSRANPNCSLEDLSKLRELRKLSIYTSSNIFPEDKDVTTLERFVGLRKLTITWGAGAFLPKSDNNAKKEKGAPQATEDKKTRGVDGTQPIAATGKSAEESEEKKRQARDAAQPIAAAAKSPEESEEKKRQARDAAQPIAAAAKSPEESEEKKRQARDAAQPIAVAAKSPEESEEKKRQATDAAQPIAAAAKSPEESEEKERQARDAAQPIAATAKSPAESEEKKGQDRDAAQPIAATAKSPEESEDKIRQDRDAAQPIAATAKSPEQSEEKKRQDRDAAQPITTTVTTTLKNSGDNKNVSQPRERSTMNPENVGDNRKPGVIEKLEKLDLKCYPGTIAPIWLQPRNLPDLKKLYIRGGTLQNLSSDKWEKVEALRLKFLSNLKMDYKMLRSSFPKLIYLENFKCPNLTYFPCNEKGIVWLK
ncbi:uncharacterized protein LOC132169955 [Corylus avellana]|uniref:uncharacterized protein LOC132169955 n=1 Tax=Corylus avellana TaxID=13451 RepID=UPI001E2370E5|nr:uncharacterized protein LOC132169955 [Corylus avellana]